MIQAVAGQTTAVVVVSAVTVLAFAVTALIVGLVVLAAGAGGGNAARDVERYLELMQEARSLLPSGSAFADPNGETSTAIERFLAKKEEARRALWESHGGTAVEHAASEPSRLHPERRGAPHRRREAPQGVSPANT